jgi:hypothetical protein
MLRNRKPSVSVSVIYSQAPEGGITGNIQIMQQAKYAKADNTDIGNRMKVVT